ncbi:MAG: site-2 protease family protein [Micromonosporaceae bacterium]
MPGTLGQGYDENGRRGRAAHHRHRLRSIGTVEPAKQTESDQRPTPPIRRSGIALGRVIGVPVFLAPSWLLLAVAVTLVYGGVVAERRPELGTPAAYLVGFGFVISLAVSVLLHELGHALTCRRYGIGVRAITLEMLGGYTEMEDEAPRPSVEALVALAGPLVSAVLGVIGVVAVVVLPTEIVLFELAFQFAAANVIVAVFNLLPGLPLDGGRALRAGVWAVARDKHLGSRVAGWAGRVVAVLVVLGLAAGWVFGVIGPFGLVFAGMVAMVLWIGAGHAIRAGTVGAQLGGLAVRDLVRPAIGVPSQTSLAEALRRADPQGEVGIVVTDAADRPVAVVGAQAADAVPEERRPWVPVDSVARTLGPGLTLPVELSGEAVLRAVQAHPATEYLVVAGEEVLGVMRAEDLAHRLDARRNA